MAKKRAHILPRSEMARSDEREAVVITGTCRIGDRPAEEVLIIDLGATGCRVRGNSLGVTKSEPLELQIADVGPLAARLKWIKKGSLGVAFNVPLDEAALQKLYETPLPPPNVVPLRRRSA